ncbi:MAG: NYN domain-containing protein [Patescibacteria group bacterium]
MLNNYTEKLKSALKKRVYIYIDAANFERSVQDMWVNSKDIPNDLKNNLAGELRYRIDYLKVKEYFAGISDSKEIKFYSADFGDEKHAKFLWFLKKVLKYKLETKPLKEYLDHTPEAPHRKANFDVELAVDATYNLDKYDTLVLFSGDCDFEYLIKFLKGHGKVVIVFSRAGHVAKELPPASSYYFDIVDFRQELLKIEPKTQKIPL